LYAVITGILTNTNTTPHTGLCDSSAPKLAYWPSDGIHIGRHSWRHEKEGQAKL